jgi:hypothetical protein
VLDDLYQVRGRLALRHKRIYPFQGALWKPLIRGQQSDWNVRLASFHVPCDDIPIHARHVVVEEHQIYGMRGKQLQSVYATGRNQNPAPSFFQQHLATFKAIPFIIDT